MTARLADYIKDTPPVEPSAPEADTPVEQVFDFPDRPQPTVVKTVERMAREVILPGEPTADEMEAAWEAAAQTETKPDIAGAFARGAKLRQPEPLDEEVDPTIKAPRSSRLRKNPGGRPAGSDQFTDLFATGMIVLISFSLGDEFLPTEDEAKDLARPIGNMLARRIDLAKTLGQDANDVVAFSIAMMAYMVRVGPIAVDRVRSSYSDRQERIRTNRVSGAGLANGEDSMAARDDGREPAGRGATRSPLDVIAQTRADQFGVLGRDLGAPSNGRAALAD